MVQCLALPKRLFFWRPSVESGFPGFGAEGALFQKSPGPRSWAIWPPKKKKGGQAGSPGVMGLLCFFFCWWVAWKKTKSSKDIWNFYMFHPQNGGVFRGNGEQKWWIFPWSFVKIWSQPSARKLLNFGQGALDIMDALIIAQANPFIKAGLVGVGWFGFGGRWFPIARGKSGCTPEV